MKHLALILAGLTLSTAALAGAADQVEVRQPYVRLAPPNAMATGAFMVIRNTGKAAVRLVKAANPLSRATELHTHLNDNGVMRMRPLPSIEVPAGGEAVLQPGGMHVMLIDLRAPMQEGDVVPIALTFDDGSSKQVGAPVRKTMPATHSMH